MEPLFLVGVALRREGGRVLEGVGTCRRHRLVLAVNAKIKRVKKKLLYWTHKKKHMAKRKQGVEERFFPAPGGC